MHTDRSVPPARQMLSLLAAALILCLWATQGGYDDRAGADTSARDYLRHCGER